MKHLVLATASAVLLCACQTLHFGERAPETQPDTVMHWPAPQSPATKPAEPRKPVVLLGTFEEGMALANRGRFGEAVKIWDPLAQTGHVEAQAILGQLYLQGEALRQSIPLAAKWYGMAAEQGHTTGLFVMGTFYHKGYGVARDDGKALKMLTQAVKQGNADAMLEIARMHFSGHGVKADRVKAYTWAYLADSRGVKDAADLKERLAVLMSDEDLKRARLGASKCFSSRYKDC